MAEDFFSVLRDRIVCGRRDKRNKKMKGFRERLRRMARKARRRTCDVLEKYRHGYANSAFSEMLPWKRKFELLNNSYFIRRWRISPVLVIREYGDVFEYSS